MDQISFRHLNSTDFPSLVQLSDSVFGKGYYTENSFLKIKDLLTENNRTASWVAEKDSLLVGFRIVFLPGSWLKHSAFKKSLKEFWGCSPDKTAYFKTVCIHKDFRRKKIGSQLANLAIQDLKSLHCKAIVTHSWDESYDNSSRQYLNSVGFKEVGPIPNFWHEEVYDCDVCQSKPCVCNATEMILRL